MFQRVFQTNIQVGQSRNSRHCRMQMDTARLDQLQRAESGLAALVMQIEGNQI